MRARSPLTPWGAALFAMALAGPAALAAQATSPSPPPQTPAGLKMTMDDAVRLALERNQTLRAQRLTIDESKADEITASLKPNPTLSLSSDGFTVFSPKQMNWSFFGNSVQYSAGLDYVFERGGKRDKRIVVAADNTDIAAKNVLDDERQLRFQAQQAFINVLLAKSTLELAQDDLKNYSNVVDLNQQRVTSGDLAEGDFLPIKLQKLQFEQDVSAAQLGLIQSKAALRQIDGFETVPEDFDVVGELAYVKVPVALEPLTQAALIARPDLQAAQSGLKLAQDQATLEVGNRARDIDGSVDYTRNGFGPVSTLGVGASFDLPFHDRNQGNIAHTKIAIQQAQETETATRITVKTDVIGAVAQFQTNEKIVALYQSGYLDEAKQSLDINTYVFQRGAGTLLNLLDAERTYRATQLAYRQALAVYMTSVQQINFVVGKQVIP